MGEHTPTPWHVTRYVNYWGFSIHSDTGFGCIAERWEDHMDGDRSDTMKANAEFIVTACNSHEDLVRALEDIVNYEPKYDEKIDSQLKALNNDINQCPDCAICRKREWPPSGLCNEHYSAHDSLLSKRKEMLESDETWGRVRIARAAIAKLREKQTA